MERTATDFWSYVDIRKPNECWEWMGCRGRGGYGQVTWDGRLHKSHRIAWQLANKTKLPRHAIGSAGINVLHKCDNRPCCNPAHLFLGTQRDNVADMMSKGRGNGSRGETHPRAKLTRSQVTEIRAVYAAGGTKQQELAEQFGITQVQVSSIVRRASWATT